THRFADNFEWIAPRDLVVPAAKGLVKNQRWLSRQRWLALSESTQTAILMRRWLKKQNLLLDPFMELDSFDVIVHLVALGMGVSLVPQRALAPFARKEAIQRLSWKPRFQREIVVAAGRHRSMASHVQRFVDCVLF